MNADEMSRVWQEKSREEFEHLAKWRTEQEEATLAEIEAMMDQHLNRVRAVCAPAGSASQRTAH